MSTVCPQYFGISTVCFSVSAMRFNMSTAHFNTPTVHSICPQCFNMSTVFPHVGVTPEDCHRSSPRAQSLHWLGVCCLRIYRWEFHKADYRQSVPPSCSHWWRTCCKMSSCTPWTAVVVCHQGGDGTHVDRRPHRAWVSHTWTHLWTVSTPFQLHLSNTPCCIYTFLVVLSMTRHPVNRSSATDLEDTHCTG